MPEELYAKPSLISNSMKGPSQALRDYNFSFEELQNHLTLFKRWINTLFNTLNTLNLIHLFNTLNSVLSNDTLMPFNDTKLYTSLLFSL